MPESKQQLAVLTIAGTDSSGGAGIQADLKAFAALGCYGTSAITAMTAQNTTGVQDVHPSPPKFVEQQIFSVLEDIDVRAIKTGMLFDADNTRAIVNALKKHYANAPIPPLVCDPVCVSTSGHTLLHPDAVDVMILELFPIAKLITPNKAEAELLLSRRKLPAEITSLYLMLEAAQNLLQLGPNAVLLKGGHMTVSLADVDQFSESHPEIHVVRQGLYTQNMEILQLHHGTDFTSVPLVLDVLYEEDRTTTFFVRPRLESTSTHGTGCTLSAAIACGLADGLCLVEATRRATVYTHLGIINAQSIGKGHGPLNHLHSFTRRIIPLPSEVAPFPLTRYLIESTAETWKDYVEHEFVKLLGRGTLPKELFVHFIKQDYIYLRYYARAYALLAAKASSFTAIGAATQTILNVLRELDTHRSMCARFGVSREELENAPESDGTTAYGAYIIDVGLRGDTAELLMALLACLIGYGEVGMWLKRTATRDGSWVMLEGNPYLHWIEDYSGEHYQGAVKAGMDAIETLAVADPPSEARLKQWCEVFKRCTRLERGFWDMAMKRS